MAKKIKKTIQRVETAKVSEKFKTENSFSLDDLKLKLAGTENVDELAHLKSNLNVEDNDPLADLKRALLNNIEEEKEEEISEIFEELDNEEITEEEVIEEILELEIEEEKIEEIVDESIIETVEEKIEDPVIEKVEMEEEIIDVEKYYYKYSDSHNNNMLIRNIEKRNNERMIVNIAMNNLNYENYFRLTSTPFEIYHNDVKILDFYQFQKSTSTSYNFKKDIYILRNNLIIDSKTYLLEEIKIVNISL